jgi:oligopeptide/dipeptide ABC transporter ATP-binding protein
VKAVDHVSFNIRAGETLGLVGESGCGKTTVGRTILRLVEPTAGQVLFEGQDVTHMRPREFKPMRREMQIVFQDPYSCLDPRAQIGSILGDPLALHGVRNAGDRRDRVMEIIGRVGLAEDHLRRYPHEFSGGQRQRIGIARALVLRPKFIVCDEPVSALDVSIQSQVLNLLRQLQREFKLTYLFIAHNMSVVEHISDRVVVMYVGKLVESACTEELFSNPRHPYTEALLSAVPKPDPRIHAEVIVMPGEVADPAHPPSGCYFHPRCRYCVDRCVTEEPALREIGPDHYVSCHRAEELTLVGVPRLA